jgi:hypothetical protein
LSRGGRGPSGGGEIRCPHCGSGYGLGFGHQCVAGKIDPGSFLFWFCPNERGRDNEFVHGMTVEKVQVKLLSGEL